MPSLADAFGAENRKRRRAVAKTIGTFKVATVDPTFTVYLDGSAAAVPALKVAGLTYAVDQTGIYLHRQGQKPVCLPTI